MAQWIRTFSTQAHVRRCLPPLDLSQSMHVGLPMNYRHCDPIVYQALGLADSWEEALGRLVELVDIVPIHEREVNEGLRVCSQRYQSLWACQLLYAAYVGKGLNVPGLTREQEGKDSGSPQAHPALRVVLVARMMSVALHFRQRRLARAVGEELSSLMHAPPNCPPGRVTGAVTCGTGWGTTGTAQCDDAQVMGEALLLLRCTFTHLYAAEGKWVEALRLLFHNPFPRQGGELQGGGEGHSMMDTIPVQDAVSSSHYTQIAARTFLHAVRGCGKAGQWKLAIRLYQYMYNPQQAPALGALTHPLAKGRIHDNSRIHLAVFLAVVPHRTAWFASLELYAQWCAMCGTTTMLPRDGVLEPMTPTGSLAGPTEGRLTVALCRLLRHLPPAAYRTTAATDGTPNVWECALRHYSALKGCSASLAVTSVLSLLLDTTIPSTVSEEVTMRKSNSHIANKPSGRHTGMRSTKQDSDFLFPQPSAVFRRWAPVLHRLSVTFFRTFGVPILPPELGKHCGKGTSAGTGSGTHSNPTGGALLSSLPQWVRQTLGEDDLCVVLDTNVLVAVLQSDRQKASFEAELLSLCTQTPKRAGCVVHVVLPFIVLREFLVYVRVKWRGAKLESRQRLWKRFLSLLEGQGPLNRLGKMDGETTTMSTCTITGMAPSSKECSANRCPLTVRWVVLSPLQDAPSSALLPLLPPWVFESSSDPDRTLLASILHLQYLLVDGRNKQNEEPVWQRHRLFAEQYGVNHSFHNVAVWLEKKNRTGKFPAVSTAKPVGQRVHEKQVIFYTKDRNLLRRCAVLGVYARSLRAKPSQSTPESSASIY